MALIVDGLNECIRKDADTNTDVKFVESVEVDPMNYYIYIEEV